jgi:hypothetical protein
VKLTELFRAIDQKDTARFSSFLAPGCVFRFGNAPVVEGVRSVEQYVGAFFDSIKALSHELIDVWDVPGGVVCHGRVTYTRHDGSVLTVPFSNVFKLDTAGIAQYLIFADTSELYR